MYPRLDGQPVPAQWGMAGKHLFDFDPVVGRVDVLVAVLMTEVRLSDLFGNAGFAQYIFDGNAQRMETSVRVGLFKIVANPELCPFVTPLKTLVLAGHGVGLGCFDGLQFLKKWQQLGMQRFKALLTALLEKPNRGDRAGQIEVRHGVDVGLIEPDAVQQGNRETVGEPSAVGFRLGLNCRPDFLELVVGVVGEYFSLGSLHDNLTRGIAGAIAALDRLAQQPAKYFKFQNSCVASGFVLAIGLVGGFAPSDVFGAVLISRGGWGDDLFLGEKHGQSAPCGKVALAGATINLVIDESFYPKVPPAYYWGCCRTFGQGFLSPDLLSFAGIGTDSDTKAGGFAGDQVGHRVAIADPPKGGLGLFVKAGHWYVLVCMRSQNTTKRFNKYNGNQMMTYAFTGLFVSGVRIPLSPPLRVSSIESTGFCKFRSTKMCLAATLLAGDFFTGGDLETKDFGLQFSVAENWLKHTMPVELHG